MGKIKKSLKFITVFITVIAFCFTFIYIPSDNSLYAASTKIKVYIDAGHGGSDPGAIRSDLKEKDANLDIALRLKSKLEANGFEVVMTRTNDAYSTLDDRVNKANSSGADIFLSIHNNAAVSEYAHGTETYWCANGVNGSNQFAKLVQSNLVNQIGRANRGVKTADFKVIKYTKMPAALVECAFVSNPKEAELLKDTNFREKCAIGLYNAIKEFSKGIKKSGGSSGSSGSSGSRSSDKTGSTGSIVTTSGREFSEFTIKVLGLEPANDSVVTENFKIIGWSADIKNSPPIELKKVEFYKGPERNKSNLLGTNKSFQNNILGATGIVNGGWEETIEISMLDEGENIIYVYAYDKNDNYSTANVKVNVIKNNDAVPEENHNPVANPGGPYTGKIGEVINFDGSGSQDTDGSIVEYIWDFGDGSSASGDEARPAHIYNEAGEYTITLTVKDDKGATSEAATSKVIVEEEIVEGDGVEDDEENNGEEDETPEDGKEEDGTADKEDIIGENSQESSGGQEGNTGSEQTKVTPPAKTVVASAGEDKTEDAGKELTFDASASTVSPLSDGVVITYSWDWNGDGTYDETVNEPVIKHTYDKAGTYTVTLKVTAFDSITSTDSLTVTINEPNKVPTANAGGPYTATAGKELTLDGSKSSDSDGTIKEYIWDFGDGSKTGSGVKPVHTYSKADTYTVKLTVKDDKGATSEAATKVTVKEAEKTKKYSVNTSPITNQTSVIGYTEVTADQLVKIFKNRNLSSDVIKRAERIAPLYINYGKIFNIRADIAWAQMCHETGFLTYGGIVPPSANNFCGLGATGEKDKNGINYLYNKFATEEFGVIAHYAHLAWYYYPDHINGYCSLTYDPRHSDTHWRYTGDTTLGFLNGRWAPGRNYTEKIILFANQIYY